MFLPSIKNIGSIKSFGDKVFSETSLLDQLFFLFLLSLKLGYVPVIIFNFYFKNATNVIYTYILNLNVKKEERVLDFSDFQKQEIKFDISKLQEAYNQIIQTKKFEDAGVTHFGAISLTQIPGDPDSIKGNKARGLYWTKPDRSGKEVMREGAINESAYSLSLIHI